MRNAKGFADPLFFARISVLDSRFLWLSHLQTLPFIRDAQGLDLDGFAVAFFADDAGKAGRVTEFLGQSKALLRLRRIDIDGKAHAHVEGGVGFARIHWAVLLDELEDWWHVGNAGDAIDERLLKAHQLAPAVAGDVDGVVRTDISFLQGGKEAHVDDRGIEQSRAVRTAIADRREVALRQSLG